VTCGGFYMDAAKTDDKCRVKRGPYPSRLVCEFQSVVRLGKSGEAPGVSHLIHVTGAEWWQLTRSPAIGLPLHEGNTVFKFKTKRVYLQLTSRRSPILLACQVCLQEVVTQVIGPSIGCDM